MWSVRFRLRQYLKESLWFLPLIGGLIGVALGELAPVLDDQFGVPARWEYSASTASAVLSAIVGATAALTGFVVTVSVLVVQMATSTFSARYMRLWQRDRMLQSLLAVLVGTFAFAFTSLRAVETNSVPDVAVSTAGALMALSLFLFLFFLDRFVHRLRPVAVAALVARACRESFVSAVAAAKAPDSPRLVSAPIDLPEAPTHVVRSTEAGAIQALDGPGLVRFARERGYTVVLRHVVGDFVPDGGAIANLYGDAPPSTADERRLRAMFALGAERTIEQDPAFGIRIMVDIAIRALSPAVNDPTTAVQVLNHLGDSLRLIGETDLDPSREAASAGSGSPVVIPIRGWDEYLELGVTEIREYGGSSVQVTRRLRAMLEDLRRAVRPEHRAAVDEELARLDATVARTFGDSVDLDRASEADHQGIGGPTAGASAGVGARRTL